MPLILPAKVNGKTELVEYQETAKKVRQVGDGIIYRYHNEKRWRQGAIVQISAGSGTLSIRDAPLGLANQLRHEWAEQRLLYPANKKITSCKYCGIELRPGENDNNLCGGAREEPRHDQDRNRQRL